ncbi:MAG: 1-acyl-sn-glycerol-3-phosphate acyltransferase [Planctomycetes bacterium]|nr:1-acyl-sn-glycerol-3-phosphate acyltransferase [Planctomycetota bacterium]
MIDYDRLSTPPPRWDDALFCAFRVGVRLMLRICFRWRVEGAPPASGGYVLAANHTSYLDPLILGASVPRRVIYLMTETVWRSASAGWFYRWNRAIPLSARGGNRDALRAARKVLAQQRVVGIFPEGGLSRDGKLMLGSPGAVSLVLNEGRPIVPVGIVGAADALPPGASLPRFGRVTVRYGEPILPEEIAALGGGRRERLQNATRLIMRRIAELTGQEAREDVLEAAGRDRVRV